MKKVYVVELITKSVQQKLVLADSPEHAKELVEGMEWNGKEEVLDTDTEARVAVISGKQKDGEYPDFYPSDYVETEDGAERYQDIRVGYFALSELDKSK